MADGASPRSLGLLIFQYSHEEEDNNDSMRGMWQWEPDGNGMERVGIGSNKWTQNYQTRHFRVEVNVEIEIPDR